MGSEVWQFLIVVSGFIVATVLWLFVVHLPGRTLERWKNQRNGHGKDGPEAGLRRHDGSLKPES